MASLITTIHIFCAILLVLIVLLQHGRGADLGASFGGGSQTLFGAGGADNLLIRVTTILALVFLTTSLVLARSTGKVTPLNNGNLFKTTPTQTTPAGEPVAKDKPQATSPTPQAEASTEPAAQTTTATPAETVTVEPVVAAPATTSATTPTTTPAAQVPAEKPAEAAPAGR
ncbi:preprotein translocase subunit SecG [bacterium]|nr:preprotein translocase subunit SecG [bacterium]